VDQAACGIAGALAGRDGEVIRGEAAAGAEWTSAKVRSPMSSSNASGFAPVAVFEQRELEGCGAADEEPAATASLLLRDPLAAAVLANQKERGGRHGHLLFRPTGDFARRCPQSRETAAAAM
jgi:hypothetical protein